MFKQMKMVKILFYLIIPIGLTSCFPNPRYSLDKDFNLVNCDKIPIYGITIDKNVNGKRSYVGNIYYNREKDPSGTEAFSELNLIELGGNYYLSESFVFEAGVIYDITIGGGDVTGGFEFLVDSVDGKLQIIKGTQLCEEK